MDNNLQINHNAEQTYHSIRQSIVSAQHKLSAAVNYAMVITYWEIGEQIYKACGENDRAAYGKNLLDYLSPPNSKIYPPPSFQESPINTHPHRERRESGRVSSCPPSLTTVTPPPTKSGVGYLSTNRYLDRLQHTGS